MKKHEADELVVPKSVAVIMDGNGRWAKRAGFERIRGHEKGIDAVRTTVTECARLGVEALVLYAFSEENWARPKREIDMLFKLLKRFLVDERDTLMDNDVQLLHSGRRERLADDVRDLLDEQALLPSQVRQFCTLLLGDGVALPEPELDPRAFVTAVTAALRAYSAATLRLRKVNSARRATSSASSADALSRAAAKVR